jgi:hypothetical protein
MSNEIQHKRRNSMRPSRVLRFVAFVILAVMILLALVAQFTTVETVDTIEATVQAGVNLRLTEAVVLTGTPDATTVQGTVDASIDATLTQIAVPSPTPIPVVPPPTGVSGFFLGIWNFIAGFVMTFVGMFTGLWNFAGRGGVVVQGLCCVLPVLAIIIGIVND